MIFLDTSFIVSCKMQEDQNHQKSVEIMAKIKQGSYGDAIISDYIFDETLTVIFSRSKKLQLGIEIGNELKNSFGIMKIDNIIFENAFDIFKNQKDTKLSFTDCTSIAVMKSQNIKHIATFDKDFTKIKEIEVV